MFKEFGHDEYRLKIYFKLNKNILRVELKLKSTKAIKRHGINTLKDLSNKDNLNSLYSYLIKQFNNLFISSSLTPPEGLNERQEEIFYDHIIAGRYKKIRRKRFSRTTAWRRENEFEKILELNNLKDKKIEVLKLLDEKYFELSNNNYKE